MKNTFLPRVLSGALVICAAGWASAADITWNYSGTDFNTGTNWTPNSVPGTGDRAAFFGAAGGNQPNLSAARTVQGVLFGDTASSGYVLSGSAITLTNVGSGSGNAALVALNTSGTNKITANIVLGAAAGASQYFLQAPGGTLDISGNISSANALSTLYINASGTSARTVTLSGSNTYSANTRFSTAGGTLNLNHASAISSGVLIVSQNHSIDNTTAAAITLANNNINLGATLTFVGTKDLSFGSGTATVTGGNRQISTTAGTLTLGSIDADTTARTFTKSGAGTLAITGAAGSNFQGGTVLNGGTTLIGNKSSLGTGLVTVTGSSNLAASSDLDGGNAVANAVALNHHLVLAGSKNLTLSGTITQGSTGDRTIENNNTGATELSGPIFLSNTAGTGRVLTLAGSQSMTVSGVIANFDGAGTAGGLTITNTETVNLTGNNTYTGATTVSAGTLLINGAHSGAGTVTVQAAGAIGGNGSIAGNLSLTAGADFVFSLTSTLTVDGSSVTFGGFSLANVIGLDGSVALGTYSLINGSATFDYTNVSNFGIGNKASIGGGKEAYFQGTGLQVVVIPEPSTVLLAVSGLAATLLLRRRRS